MISMQVPSQFSKYLPGIDIISNAKLLQCLEILNLLCLVNSPTVRDDREQLPVGAALGNTHNIYTKEHIVYCAPDTTRHPVEL